MVLGGSVDARDRRKASPVEDESAAWLSVLRPVQRSHGQRPDYVAQRTIRKPVRELPGGTNADEVALGDKCLESEPTQARAGDWTRLRHDSA